MPNSFTDILIGSQLAEYRIKQFLTKKQFIDNALNCNVSLKISCNPAIFLQLLEKIKLVQNGFRCYFVKDLDQDHDELSVIFSVVGPTQGNIDLYYKLSVDDNELRQLTCRDVWINWVPGVVPFLAASSKTQPPHGETKSIYYEAKDIDQLITVFKSGVQYINICFAAYNTAGNTVATPDDAEYINQLALIFELITKDPFHGKSKFYFGFGRRLLTGSSYADTGVPCPPPPTGSQCPGA